MSLYVSPFSILIVFYYKNICNILFFLLCLIRDAITTQKMCILKIHNREKTDNPLISLPPQGEKEDRTNLCRLQIEDSHGTHPKSCIPRAVSGFKSSQNTQKKNTKQSRYVCTSFNSHDMSQNRFN